MPSNPNSALIVRANAIESPYDEAEKKQSTAERSKEYFSKFLSSTVEKAKNELSHRTSTLRRSKRSPTAATKQEKELRRASWNSNQAYSQLTATDSTIPTITMDRPSGSVTMSNLRRDDDASDRSTSTKSSQLTNGSSSNTSDGRSGRSSVSGGSNSLAPSLGVKKKPALAPPLKPTTILSLADRDLVIIDGNDIKESVQNESEVIVVDNPRSVQSQAAATGEVDLMDILGRDWPASAGDTAHVLNASTERKTNGPPIKPNLGELTTRNRSMNIISHLKNTKSNTLPRNVAPTMHMHTGSVGGSANSSFESSHSGGGGPTSTKKSE